MTIFGARKSKQRGKPRYLFLFLVVILLAVLAAIGIWSSIFLASRTPDTAVAAAPEAVAPAEAPAAVATGGSAPAATEAAAVEVQAPAALPAPETGTAPVTAEAPQAVVAPTETETAAAAPTAPEALDAQPTSQAGPQPQAVTAETEPQPQPEPQPEPAPLDGTALTSATGSAATTRPATDEPQDTIVLAEIDTRVSTSDVTALAPPSANTDPAPSAQPLPPPFGTLYQFDAEGRIIPTAEGIITPEGVLLVAGKPPRVPPARPEPPAAVAATTTPEPAAAETTPTAAAAEAAPATATPEPFFADPALAGARPRVRPEGLAPVPQTADDDAALSDAQPVQVVSLKPRERPAELLARGEAALAARTAEASAAAQAASASLVAGLDDTGGGSPLAVAVSRKPAARPATMDRSIEAAVQLAAADASLVTAPTPPVLAEPASAAAPAPVEPPPAAIALAPAVAAKPAKPRTSAPDEPAPTAFSKNEPDETERAEIDEPDSGGTAASTATRSVVAKQATFRNALNMSQVSLIGVFGSPSNRYAMVRQPGGRFVKVSVGDRIDGGKVAAISERELSYVKNGQTHRLSLPRG